MSKNNLLIEICTEELPPKALYKLASAFANEIVSGLIKANLLYGIKSFDAAKDSYTIFATPRRLAVLVKDVLLEGEAQSFSEKLMPVSVGLDSTGSATPALLKKLAAKGLENTPISDLKIENDGKQDCLFLQGIAPGRKLDEDLQGIFDNAIDSLPIPKVMRYQLADGLTSVRFVRPVHSILAMWGAAVIPITGFGLSASNATFGHRFMGRISFPITSADTYAKELLDEGSVVASYDERKEFIKTQLESHSKALGLNIGYNEDVANLIDEVCSLVEYPVIYTGKFEEKFLSVPSECLILTMRLNQKYFPLFNADNTLSNKFLIVSNMKVTDSKNIIEGNERVVRPRLSDAEFFFETDKKQSLESMLPALKNVVYHNKIGTQFERIERLQKIASFIAKKIDANVDLATRAAYLAKADLNSQMVGEFPELQGIMGAYYAKFSGEPDAVCDAIREQYMLRFDAYGTNTDTTSNAGTKVATSSVNSDANIGSKVTSAILFITDRIETLVGMWGIGQAPTGERDPYGLRRAALGIISAYEAINKHNLSIKKPVLSLKELIDFVASLFTNIQANTATEVENFIFERLRNQLITNTDKNTVEAVISLRPPIHEVYQRLEAVKGFKKLPEAESLSAANKRISNILKKVENIESMDLNENLFTEQAEKDLYATYKSIEKPTFAAFNNGEYNVVFSNVAKLKEPVDKFFEDVMVMADDQSIRNNRISLLQKLHALTNLVADISLLAN